MKPNKSPQFWRSLICIRKWNSTKINERINDVERKCKSPQRDFSFWSLSITEYWQSIYQWYFKLLLLWRDLVSLTCIWFHFLGCVLNNLIFFLFIKCLEYFGVWCFDHPWQFKYSFLNSLLECVQFFAIASVPVQEFSPYNKICSIAGVWFTSPNSNYVFWIA